MVGLSESVHSTGVQSQHHNTSFPKKCCINPPSKMVKVASLLIVISLLIVFVTIVVYADPQGESTTPKRPRAKQPALRKKKPLLAKVKLPEVTTTLVPSLEDDPEGSTSDNPDLSSDATSTASSSSNETSISADTMSSTLSTPTSSIKVKKNPSRSNLTPTPRSGPVPEGCGECDLDECNTPPDSSCSTGLVMDRCGCCYVCGAGEGHRCYNSSLSLPYNPDVGICGPGMSCLLRNDLEPNEPREALCECRDSRIVCGSNGQTYLSECRLREAAHSRQGLVVSSWSPCVAAPMITTPVENVTIPIGEDVSMSCEVRGYPAPVLHWEFLAENSNSDPLVLPGDDSGIVIVVRGGPEQMMTTSWIQMISVNPRRQGTYFCIANNPVGSSKSVALVRIYRNTDDDEDDQ